MCPCVRVFKETESPSIPKWLQTERREAFEGHLNAYEVSLLCREAEDSVYPYLYEPGGGGNHTMDDDINQNTAQYLQVKCTLHTQFIYDILFFSLSIFTYAHHYFLFNKLFERIEKL